MSWIIIETHPNAHVTMKLNFVLTISSLNIKCLEAQRILYTFICSQVCHNSPYLELTR